MLLLVVSITRVLRLPNSARQNRDTLSCRRPPCHRLVTRSSRRAWNGAAELIRIALGGPTFLVFRLVVLDVLVRALCSYRRVPRAARRLKVHRAFGLRMRIDRRMTLLLAISGLCLLVRIIQFIARRRPLLVCLRA